MTEFHQRLHREGERLRRAREEVAGDVHGREMNHLQNALSEYLQTPIRADKEAIQGAIHSSFRQILETSALREPPGLILSIEGEIIPMTSGQPPLRRLLLNGSRYLADLGFDPGKKGGNVFESSFIVRGGENLDILEHLVRDVLGIYATTHGKHLREFDRYSYCLYNVIHGDGPREEGPGSAEFEVALFFTKPGPEKIKYSPFRSALISLMNSLKQEIPLPGMSLYQRKLGLGTGVEFVLRMMVGSERVVDDIANWLDHASANDVVHRALAVDGRLALKRIIYPLKALHAT